VKSVLCPVALERVNGKLARREELRRLLMQAKEEAP